MEETPNIVNLNKVVEPYLNGGKLIVYSQRYLTKPGDNYGSIILSIIAEIKCPNGETQRLPVVAKLPPLTNEIFWKIFNPLKTAPREYTIYEVVAPTVCQLQRDAEVPKNEFANPFAKLYGCRISLNEEATMVDRDAVLVLENLLASGYRAGIRRKMFDYKHIRFVLKNLAKYHALPIAVRQRNPDHFRKDILPKFTRYDSNQELTPEMELDFRSQVSEEVRLSLNDARAYDRFIELVQIFKDFMGNPEECEDGLFTTIAHYDLWTNNILIKYDSCTEEPEKMKIVDFQLSQYESLMHDVVFLLLSSVETAVVEEHFYDLLQYYYSEFIRFLEMTHCPTENYSFDKFMEEFHRIARVQIYHAIYMARIIYAEDTVLPDNFKDIDLSTLNKPPSEPLAQKIRDIVKLAQTFGVYW